MPINQPALNALDGSASGPVGGLEAGYMDSEIGHIRSGDAFFWRHLHWGLYESPEVEDPSPERYLVAAARMTDHMVEVAGVGDGASVLDVGCGFGGTLDYVGDRHRGCRLVGINIDERQLQNARQLLDEHAFSADPIHLVTADGCSLPVADNSVDHVLAVECIFHFPSRKQFFREVARVLRPGGTLAISDLLLQPGMFKAAAQRLDRDQKVLNDWWGGFHAPKTPDGYERLGRATGFDLLVNEDVNTETLPTYPALRHLTELGKNDTYHDVSLKAVDSLESFAVERIVTYHILSFRRRST